MNCFTNTVGVQHSIVYDVNGNEVGTAEDIFGAGSNEFSSLDTPHGRMGHQDS